MYQAYEKYLLEQLEKLIAIPSPSGYFDEIQEYLASQIQEMGYEPRYLNKGGLQYCLGGEGEPLVVMAHADTLGAQVKQVKPDGRLQIVRVGGLNPNNVETENVTVHTRFDGDYEGTILLENASTHVNDHYNEVRTFEHNLEVVLDKLVSCKAETEALGIRNGDYITIHPRFEISTDGFIKSRFLDDKIGVAILLAFTKYVRELKPALNRKVYIGFTVYEEVLHGGGAGIPEDAVELLGLDMGCVGTGLEGSETRVSIVARDNYGPYNNHMITCLTRLCVDRGIDFAVDCYSGYVSDVAVALVAGRDVRHGLIGPGVYASHSYERTNFKAVEGTFRLLNAYLTGN
ncbi:MAG: M42 family metallopeptidase [Clostridiaceae bacterium]|nr:M42 family metallopeptidase [Clostridiaceae bacterium]